MFHRLDEPQKRFITLILISFHFCYETESPLKDCFYEALHYLKSRAWYVDVGGNCAKKKCTQRTKSSLLLKINLTWGWKQIHFLWFFGIFILIWYEKLTYDIGLHDLTAKRLCKASYDLSNLLIDICFISFKILLHARKG